MTDAPIVTLTVVGASDSTIMRAVASALAGSAPTIAVSLDSTPATPAAPVTPPTPTVDPYFPPDPGAALFPSPDTATSLRLGDAISRHPYLVDGRGTVFMLGAKSATLTGLYINGQEQGSWDKGASTYVQLAIRAGKVYAALNTGQWQSWVASQGSMTNDDLPAIVTPVAAAAAAAQAAAPYVPPTPPAIMPGSSGTVLMVGSGQTYADIDAAMTAAKDGDTLRIVPGTYTYAPRAIGKIVRIEGGGVKPGDTVFDGTGLFGKLAMGKGLFVPTAAAFALANLRVTHVAEDQDAMTLTCAVRPNDPCMYLHLDTVQLDGNQVGAGGGQPGCVWLVENSNIDRNGLPAGTSGNGYAHNTYFGEGTDVTIVGGSMVDPLGGHGLKTRGAHLAVTGGTYSSTDALPIDVPEGLATVGTIKGATIIKAAGAANHGIVGFGEENRKQGVASLNFEGCAFQVGCDQPFAQGNPESAVTFDAACTFAGIKPVAGPGALVKGL